MILIYDQGTTYFIPIGWIYQPFGRREAESEFGHERKEKAVQTTP